MQSWWNRLSSCDVLSTGAANWSTCAKFSALQKVLRKRCSFLEKNKSIRVFLPVGLSIGVCHNICISLPYTEPQQSLRCSSCFGYEALSVHLLDYLAAARLSVTSCIHLLRVQHQFMSPVSQNTADWLASRFGGEFSEVDV